MVNCEQTDRNLADEHLGGKHLSMLFARNQIGELMRIGGRLGEVDALAILGAIPASERSIESVLPYLVDGLLTRAVKERHLELQLLLLRRVALLELLLVRHVLDKEALVLHALDAHHTLEVLVRRAQATVGEELHHARELGTGRVQRDQIQVAVGRPAGGQAHVERVLLVEQDTTQLLSARHVGLFVLDEQLGLGHIDAVVLAEELDALHTATGGGFGRFGRADCRLMTAVGLLELIVDEYVVRRPLGAADQELPLHLESDALGLGSRRLVRVVFGHEREDASARLYDAVGASLDDQVAGRLVQLARGVFARARLLDAQLGVGVQLLEEGVAQRLALEVALGQLGQAGARLGQIGLVGREQSQATEDDCSSCCCCCCN